MRRIEDYIHSAARKPLSVLAAVRDSLALRFPQENKFFSKKTHDND